MRLRTALAASLLVVSAPATAGTNPARIRLNEIGTNFSVGCDVIELRVIECGTMEGIQLNSRFDFINQFPDFYVSRGDIVLVHVDPNGAQCTPGAPGVCSNETTGPAQFPAAACLSHFDTAYDWHATALTAGLPVNFTVVWATDALGTIMDAVCLSGSFGMNPPAGSATEIAANNMATAGEWQRPEGGVPPGGFAGPNYGAYSVKDLFAASSIGNTIQRIDDGDDNHMGDWSTTNLAPTWGRLNVGQALFGSCVTGVADELRSALRTRLQARPSVTRGSTEFHLDVPLSTGSRLEIFDAQGRAVRVLWWWAASSSVQWDGRDGWGAETPPGLYFGRVITPQGPVVARVTRMR
jgi:hypothetical protein